MSIRTEEDSQVFCRGVPSTLAEKCSSVFAQESCSLKRHTSGLKRLSMLYVAVASILSLAVLMRSISVSHSVEPALLFQDLFYLHPHPPQSPSRPRCPVGPDPFCEFPSHELHPEAFFDRLSLPRPETNPSSCLSTTHTPTLPVLPSLLTHSRPWGHEALPAA